MTFQSFASGAAAFGALGPSLSLPSPEDLARELGDAEFLKVIAPDAAPVAAARAAGGKTLLLYSEGCLAHAPSSEYGPESASRLQVIVVVVVVVVVVSPFLFL
jgi:hypothetical protein